MADQLWLQAVSLKMMRADKHVQSLQRDIGDFVGKLDRYRGVFKPNAKSGEQVLWIETDTKVPTKAWGVAVGDIAHNLRSALAHLVWAMTLDDGHSPPPNPIPRDSDWAKTDFPIYDHNATTPQWDPSNPPKPLWGIAPDLVALIQKLQPGYGGKDLISHPLWILRELNNVDKHSTINVIGFRAYALSADAPLQEGEVYRIESPGVFVHETDFGSLPADATNMEMYRKIPTEVLFEEGEIAQFRTIMEVLDLLYRFVNDVINWFDWKVRAATGPVPQLQGAVVKMLGPP